MASEPLTIFGTRARPERVVHEVRTRYPAATVDGQGADWRSLSVTLAHGTLTLLHDPSYYGSAGWATQLRGMKGYFRRFPLSDELHVRVDRLIEKFRFALGTRFEPDYEDPPSDERFGIVCGVTRLVDGVIFAPSGLRDSEGNLLVGAAGEHDDEAVWPSAE
jgi:hypothetical protein